ncbi:YdcF family protein [Microvirga sp. Mcv34]|uniref:YdcF family protein n=1 Tax=Microvirga sp. Mcv34 TaxID=2926016 RepID=UPI0021CA08F8|nr:YdcF family protein [Microvirga sp. Mcv34]
MLRKRRTVLLLGWCLLLVPPVLVAGALAEVAVYASFSDDRPADAAIILGAAVAEDRPSPVFEERIRHAVALYKAGRVRMLIATGGLGPGDKVTEAEAAQRWSLAQGVPINAIIMETRSHTTQENLAFALPLLRQHGVKHVLLVSDPLHMRRAMAIARRLGIEAAPSPTPTSRFESLSTWVPFLISETYYLARCRMTAKC